MTISKSSRRVRSAAIAVALASAIAIGIPASANAASLSQNGYLKCDSAFSALTGTESTARGSNVTHAITMSTAWGNSTMKARIGSSNIYANWGWTFWQGNATSKLTVSAGGSVATIKSGSLHRFCTSK